MLFVKNFGQQFKIAIEKKIKNPDPIWIFFSFPLRMIFLLIITCNKSKKKFRSQENTTLCIGNITVGGNGKTPFLIHLVKELKNYNPQILSKGYGRKASGDRCVEISSDFLDVGDEPLLIKREHPNVKVHVI